MKTISTLVSRHVKRPSIPHRPRIALFCILVLSPNVLFAASSGLADRVIEHKLANGMTVLMVERHQAPVVPINMTFGVGGVNEQVGQTGLAHLYEHMAFKGTRTVGTKDYEKEKPILDEIRALKKESLGFLSVDMEENPLIAEHFEVDALPVHLLYRKGKLIWNRVGFLSKAELVKNLDLYMGADQIQIKK